MALTKTMGRLPRGTGAPPPPPPPPHKPRAVAEEDAILSNPEDDDDDDQEEEENEGDKLSDAEPKTQKKKGKDKFRKSPPSSGFLSPHTEARLREAFPDFNKYIHTQTLTPKQFGLGASPPSLALPEPCPDECVVPAGTPDERVIIVGDTHGMNHSLQ